MPSQSNCPSTHTIICLTLISQTTHSTETALLMVTELLRAEPCPSHWFSFSSNCPLRSTLNCQILLATLGELGIADSALSWFKSYLTNHTYQVTSNGSLSKPCTLDDTGVPQCSVLGPLLFSLYTRSLGSVITSQSFSYHCYADDTAVPLFPPPPPPLATPLLPHASQNIWQMSALRRLPIT